RAIAGWALSAGPEVAEVGTDDRVDGDVPIERALANQVHPGVLAQLRDGDPVRNRRGRLVSHSHDDANGAPPPGCLEPEALLGVADLNASRSGWIRAKITDLPRPRRAVEVHQCAQPSRPDVVRAAGPDEAEPETRVGRVGRYPRPMSIGMIDV